MSTIVITDSGCDLTRAEAARAGIEIVPVYIIFGEQRLKDGVDIDRATFFRRMAAGEHPKTEPATQADYEAMFRKVTAGGNDAVMISLSSQISKSYENAAAAARGLGRVHVVDSRGASGMESLLSLYAVELAKSGMDAAQIAAKLDMHKLKYAAYFAVPEMTSLGRSGRLPKAVVALGSMLNVSLVLKMNEAGAIAPAGQSRNFEKTRELMVDAVVRTIEHSPRARVAISHVQDPAGAELLRQSIEAKLGHPPAQELVNESTLTIAAHMGPGALGVFAILP
jgi:DegV family protein with EDD domain